MSGIIMKNGIPYGNGDNTNTCTQVECDAWEQAVALLRLHCYLSLRHNRRCVILNLRGTIL